MRNSGNKYKLQANLKKGVPLQRDAVQFPKNYIFKCLNCGNEHNLESVILQAEAQIGKKIVL